MEEPRFDCYDPGLILGSVSVSALALVSHWWQDTVIGGRPVFEKSGAVLSLHIEAYNFCLFTDGVHVVKENVCVQQSGTAVEAWQDWIRTWNSES